jgi:hypothetical protein
MAVAPERNIWGTNLIAQVSIVKANDVTRVAVVQLLAALKSGCRCRLFSISYRLLSPGN